MDEQGGLYFLSAHFLSALIMHRMAALTISCLMLALYIEPVAGDQPCDCRCQAYPQERNISACQSKCADWWQKAQCEAEAVTASEQDAEVVRYATDLQAIGVSGSTYDIQMSAFKDAPPHLREKMWNDLEITRQALAEDDLGELQQAGIQGQSDRDYDAETLRYKAALEETGMTEAEVNGLVSLFLMSDERIREVLWNDLESISP